VVCVSLSSPVMAAINVEDYPNSTVLNEGYVVREREREREKKKKLINRDFAVFNKKKKKKKKKKIMIYIYFNGGHGLCIVQVQSLAGCSRKEVFVMLGPIRD